MSKCLEWPTHYPKYIRNHKRWDCGDTSETKLEKIFRASIPVSEDLQIKLTSHLIKKALEKEND